MKGVFGIASAAALMEKLESEYSHFVGRPHDSNVAYNFFVTAWHLLEWKYPDPGGKTTRESLRNHSPLLQVCEHIAVGAKHFEPTSAKHQSVSASERSGVWAEGTWKKGVWKEGAWASWLTITLEGAAESAYGKKIKAHEFARHVMEYWRANL